MWDFIYTHFRIKIPRYAIYGDNDAPFDFIYEAFIGKYKTILVMANRSGGKTLDFAVLNVLDALANDDCEVANLGAIQAQAQRCFNYVKKFLTNNVEFEAKTESILMSRTEFVNNSVMEILTATITGVNSPHPQKTRIDEVELIPWSILQEAFNMTQSKNDIIGQTILGSTRKFAAGPMQRLVTERNKRGIKLFKWCIWEVMEKLPDDPVLLARIKEVFGDELPENVDKCDGFYKWVDLIDRYLTLDREVWRAQWLCERPDASGLVYPGFSDTLNVVDTFQLEAGEEKDVYIFEDFGYSKDHPNVILLIQVDFKKQEITVFGELYSRLYGSTEALLDAVKDKCNEWGLGVTKNIHPDLGTSYKWGRIKGWVTDKAGATERADRMNFGCPIMPLSDNSELYEIKNSVPLVRKMIEDRRLKIYKDCIELLEEVQTYKNKKNPDGTYQDIPEKKFDHGPDALRYGLIMLFPLLAFGSFGQDVETVKEEEDWGDEEYHETITGGMLDSVF